MTDLEIKKIKTMLLINMINNKELVLDIITIIN